MEGADVKNYIRPYYRTEAALGLGVAVLPLKMSGTTVSHNGTTTGTCGTTASTSVGVRFQHNQDNEEKLQSAGKGRTSARDDSTQTFPMRTPS